MTRIEEMTEPQRQSWIKIMADSAILIWFWNVMTEGFGLVPQNFSPAQTSGIFIKLVIITIILHAGISIAFEVRKKKDRFEKDERDMEISRKGSQAGYGLLQLGVGFVIITLLAQFVIGDAYQGPVSVIEPVEMIFALSVISYLSDLYRHATILWAYKA